MRITATAGYGCILLVTILGAAPLSSVQSWSPAVDAIAHRVMDHPVAGISIGIAQNGRVVFAQGYGLANLEDSAPVTSETVFHIASISKNIVAAVLLRLTEQGKLSLDDEVTKYVPDAPVQGKRVTIRQLLTHTSGMFSITSLPDAANNEGLELTHKQVLQLLRDKSFDFEPGSSWRYNNSGFYLAGMVVESIAKTEYAQYLRQQVFQPLGMTSSLLCNAHTPVPRLATGYRLEHRHLVPAATASWMVPFAAGGVCSSANDLLKWQLALDEGRVLKASSLALMRSPTMLADQSRIDYGVGTRLGTLDGHRVIGHTGSGNGFTTVLESFPEDRVEIVVLVNTAMDSAAPIAAAIARAVLHLRPPRLLDLELPEEEAQIQGRYDSDEGTVNIFVEHGKAYYRFPGPQPVTGRLRRQSAFVYAVDDDNVVRFQVENHARRWALVYSGGLMVDAKVARSNETR